VSDRPRSETWGIGSSSDFRVKEEDVLAAARNKAAAPHASDDATETKALLYGPTGQPILVQRPRRVGFRAP
jgi:hypothetical protein